MPRYRSRSRTRKDREKKRIRMQVPRDRRKLAHWAVRGTHEDYKKLQHHAIRLAPQKPNYVSGDTMRLLQTADRRRLVEATGARDNHGTLDGLAWLLDKVPRAAGLGWLTGLGQAAMKPWRGDSLSEVDEQYARLTDQSYKLYDGVAPDTFEHWERAKEFDSDHLSVWDNADGHRFVSVRGTKPNLKDVYEDVKVAVQGRPDNLIGEELKRILDNTEPSRPLDIGAHSLGTDLVLTAFEDDDSLQDRVHQTYLYNPAYSPFTQKNITGRYEADDRVRYFIDLLDPVSVGGIGSKGPSNAVYRSSYKEPWQSHQLLGWGGATWKEHDQNASHIKKAELPYDRDGDGVPDVTPAAPVVDEPIEDILLDFGDNYNDRAWGDWA